MRRNDRLDENERSGKESKSSGPVGAIARWVDNTRARYRSRHGGVPVVTIVALVAIGVATLGLLVAPTVADTGTFEGEIVLEGDAATSSTSWSYEIADLEGVDDFSVELEGARVTESESESATLAVDEGFSVEPAGNAPPEDAIATIEGVRDETDQSEPVSDGESIEIDGNVDPVDETVTIDGEETQDYRSESGTSDDGSTHSIGVGGNVDPNGPDGSGAPELSIDPDIGTFSESGVFDGVGSDRSEYITESVVHPDPGTEMGEIEFCHESSLSIEVKVDGGQELGWTASGTGETCETFSFDDGPTDDFAIKINSEEGQSPANSDEWDFTVYTDAPDVTVNYDGESDYLGEIDSEETVDLDLSYTTDSIEFDHGGSAIDWSLEWTDRTLTEDPSVTIDGETASYNGLLGDGETTEEPINLSTGTHTVDVDATGSIGGVTVDWTEVDQSEDVAVDVGEETIFEGGLLEDGETVTESIDLSETETTEVVRTGGEHDAKVYVDWTEVAETQDPMISINGESAGYSGTLAEGTTTNLDVSEEWIEEENTVDVDLEGSNGGPEPQVGISYSHTASTVAVNESVTSTTWSEEVEVSRTFASDQSDVELRIGMPDNVVGVAEIEERRDGGEWSSVDSEDYELDGTDLEVSMGDVAAEESVDVRATGDKIRMESGSIEVVEPTIEGADLSTRMRVTDAAGDDPVGIEVSETKAGDQIHMVDSADWTPSEYHLSEASGREILYLPAAVEDAEVTVATAPLSVAPETGEATTEIDNRSEMRFSIGPGSSSGDELEIGYYGTVSGEWYELYSVTEDRQMDVDQASSPVFFSTDDRESTYLITVTDAPGSSVIAGGSSSGGGLPPALLLLAGIVGVGGVGIVSQRMGMGRRVTIPAAVVATIGIAELATPTSLLGTLSNDLIRSSSTSLVAALATAGGLAGTWLVDRRTDRDMPTWLYGAVGVGGAAWLSTSALGEAGTSVVGILVGGSILVGLWGASRRWELPRWLLAIIGSGATLFMLRSVAPGVLEGLVDAISDGAREIAPLVVLGVLIVVGIWIRRRDSGDEITLEVSE